MARFKEHEIELSLSRSDKGQVSVFDVPLSAQVVGTATTVQVSLHRGSATGLMFGITRDEAVTLRALLGAWLDATEVAEDVAEVSA